MYSGGFHRRRFRFVRLTLDVVLEQSPDGCLASFGSRGTFPFPQRFPDDPSGGEDTQF